MLTYLDAEISLDNLNINDSNLTESERAHRDDILKERENIVQDLVEEYRNEAKLDMADQDPSSSPSETGVPPSPEGGGF